MQKQLLRMGTLCLMLLMAIVVKAQDVVATWDFQHMAASAVAIQKATGTVKSDVEGVELAVDATNGKLQTRGSDAQFNAGTILKVPVKSARDLVTVVSYPGYHNYTIGGVAAEADSVTVKAKTADAKQGYVEVVGTGGSYLYRVRVQQVSAIQEKAIYETSFTEWPEVSLSTYKNDKNASPATYSAKTKYSKESITFTTWGALQSPADTKNISEQGYLMFGKQNNEIADAAAYIETSKLASITKVEFTQYATGTNRGLKLYAKGDGDADWVLLSEQPVSKSRTLTPISVTVNKTNVQLRFENLATAQNAYITELHIYGNVDMSNTPSLATFTANGTTYQAADVFNEDADGNNVTTVEISKKSDMISESNPVVAVAENGELGEISYVPVASTLNGNKTQTDATISVVLGTGEDAETAKYIIHFVWKPDYQVVYYNTDGSQVATQTVEKDAEIGTLNDGSKVTVTTGNKFRGWLLKENGDEKASAKTVVSEPTLNLYPLVTDIEGDAANDRYEYNFKSKFFYPEDHDALNLSDAKYYYNGAQHGYGINGAGSFSVKVTGNATIIYEGCLYDNASSIVVTDEAGNTVATIAKAAEDGTKTTFKYTGAATTLKFSFDNTIYVHALTVINTGTSDIAKNDEGYYVATAGDANSVLSILDVIAANEDGTNRVKIFLPDGTYDFGRMVEKEFPIDNISFIGQSKDKTILVTTPDKSVEGLGTADMFFNKKQNIYFQDLTLKNALDYYAAGSAGRAAVIQDRGNRTIFKNVNMLSYQDTYYSQNSAMQSYFSGCDIHGTVDFICGGGDVRFDSTTISLEPRQSDGAGGRTITAATTNTQFGYVFDGCKIVDLANGNGDWNFGRTWQNAPIVVWLNTTLDANAAKTIIKSRWTEKGMNNKDPKIFGEYNTKDESGANITPASNKITSYGGEFETILNADQAAAYSYEKMFTGWDPKALSAQLSVKNVKLNGTTLSWDATEGASAYAVFVDGKFAAIVSQPTYSLEATGTKYTVRAANEMGGFGPEAAATTTTGINSISNDNAVAYEYYSVDGVRLAKAQRGINIRVSRLSNGKTVTDKVIVK